MSMICRIAVVITGCLLLASRPVVAADSSLPEFLRDRGEGIPTSQFGTYIESGQWILYPFYEYSINREEEYHPSELGFVGEQDYLGKVREHEAVLFIGYAFNEQWAVEFETEIYVSSEFDRSPLDTSGVPLHLEESGFAGAEAQLRYMWGRESVRRPALYSFFEVEFPFQDTKVLIGAQDVEYAIGTGFIKGYSWGTLNGRVSVAYDGGEGQVELGEYALEYLKKLNDTWRVVATLEGEDDDLSFIGEVQLRLSSKAFLKLNSGFGITEKAPDFAPEIGVLFTF